jgi:hypothetical protein
MNMLELERGRLGCTGQTPAEVNSGVKAHRVLQPLIRHDARCVAQHPEWKTLV